MADLKINLCGVEFKNPILTAAGPGAKDAKLCELAAKGGAGGIVTKTISDKAAEIPRPCMSVVNGGFLNCESWSELSPEHWVAEEYPKIAQLELPVVVGLGYTKEQIRKIAPMVKPFADAVEMSVHYVGTDVQPMLDALKAAKDALDVPVFMKMSPHTDIISIAKKCEENGADGIILINSFGPCMAIDVETGLPRMGSENGYGWLTGAAIHPLAVRTIYEVSKEISIPIIGVGGVTNGIEAAELMMVGASVVQVCTEAIVKGPDTYGKIAAQLNDFLDKNGYTSASEIIGLTHRRMAERKVIKESIPPIVKPENCTLCKACVKSCVYDAISFPEKVAIDPQKCFGCGLCVSRCRFGALEVGR